MYKPIFITKSYLLHIRIRFNNAHRRIRYRKPIQQGISVQRPYVGETLFSGSNDFSFFWKHIDCKNSAFIRLCFTDERLLFYVYKPYFTVTQTNNENSLLFQWIEY